MKLDVGILWRNNAELVEPFFYFLGKSSGVDYRVISVDMESTDGSGLSIAGYSHLYVVAENKSVAYGRNVILGYRDKSLPLVLMDSDCFLTQWRSLEFMLATLEGSPPNVGIVRPKTVHHSDNETGIPGVCCELYRTELINEVGEFDERFSAFYDDSDYHSRAYAKGWKSVVDKKAKALHMCGQTLTVGTEAPRKLECLTKDKALYESIWGKE